MIEKFLTFDKFGTSPSGKTDKFTVMSSTGTILGSITWYANWRKYCFYPGDNMLFDSKCLNEIAEFMKIEMDLRK